MGFIIERNDGTTDGLGDAVVFANEEEAWEAARCAFGCDPASDGEGGIESWLRVRDVDWDTKSQESAARLAAHDALAGALKRMDSARKALAKHSPNDAGWRAASDAFAVAEDAYSAAYRRVYVDGHTGGLTEA